MYYRLFLSSKLLFFLLLLTLLFYSCIDREHYPVEPYIEYKGYYITKQQAAVSEICVVIISFTDGDGDIGLTQKDTLYPFHKEGDYYYNFIMNVFKKEGQEVTKYPYKLRIPPINPDDYEQPLKGEMYVDVPIDELRFILPDNKFQFEAYIYDRKLHKSNVFTSPVIVLP